MKNYYSVKSIFVYNPEDSGFLYRYEERITTWEADSFDAAIALAENEAKIYEKKSGLKYINFSTAYHMYEKYGNGKEIYSIMRDSNLDKDRFLNKFYDTGTECCGDVDPTGALVNCLDYEKILLKELEINKQKIQKLKKEIKKNQDV